MIEPVTQEDKAWIEPLFNLNKAILGPFSVAWFRYWSSQNPRDKWVKIQGIAFAHFLEKKEDGSTLYEIAVNPEQKRKGHGRALIEYIPKPILLKTDFDNEESNQFYRALGFRLLGRKPGKKKTFNVWKYF